MQINKKIVYVSFWSAVLIMMIHSNNLHLYNNVNGIVSYTEDFLIATFKQTVVPLFFVISGYLYWNKMPMLWKQFCTKYLEKLKRRVKSLVVPYITWNILYYIAFLILLSVPFMANLMSTTEISFSVKELVLAVFFHKYNGVYWYVYHLIVFSVISPLLYVLVKNRYGIWLGLLIMLLSNFCALFPNTVWGIHVDALAYWMIGGCFAVQEMKCWKQKYSKRSSILNVLLYLILALAAFYLRAYDGNIIIRIGVNLIEMAGVFTLWHSFDLYQPKKEHAYMSMSFWIYTVHPLFVDGVKKIIVNLLPDNSFWALFNYIISVMIALVLVVEIGKVVQYHLPSFWKVLMGGRGTVSKKKKKENIK